MKTAPNRSKSKSCFIGFIVGIITAGIFFVGIDVHAESTSPDKIAGLAFWLKADAGITQSKGKVSAWADQSVNANNALQSTPNKQPAYVSNGLNGNPVVQFTGAPVTMGFKQVSAQTIFIVYKDNGTTDSYGDILGGRLGVAHFHGDGAKTGKLFSSKYANSHILNGQGFVNGVAVKPATIRVSRAFHIYTIVTTKPVTFSNIANNQDQSNRFRKGDYAEIIAFSDTLSDKDRSVIEAYLAKKYAISMLKRLKTYILAHNPDIITIATHLNDMSTKPSILENNIISYVNQVLAHKNPKTGLSPQLILMTDNLSGQNLKQRWARPYAKQVDTAKRVLSQL